MGLLGSDANFIAMQGIAPGGRAKGTMNLDSDPKNPRHVFVYGTLRRGEQRDINLLVPTPAFVCHAGVRGVLYDLGAYPGLRLLAESEDGAGTDVVGEVYEITPALEQLLDEIEEVWPQATGEYAKREFEIVVGDVGATVACLVYEVSEARSKGRPVIAGGDWVQYRKGAK